MTMLTTACGGERLADGKYYDSYGLFDEESKDPNVVYRLSPASVIWAIVLAETVAFPVYIVGWDLYTPVRLKPVVEKTQN